MLDHNNNLNKEGGVSLYIFLCIYKKQSEEEP